MSWVDGGLPRSAASINATWPGPAPASPLELPPLPSGAPAASAALPSAPVASAFRRKIDAFRRQANLTITVRASEQTPAASNRGAPAATWIAGWSFEPGDPLITQRAISSASGPIGTWVAGDPPVTLPAGSAFRATGTLRVDVQRRAAADYEQPFTATTVGAEARDRFRASGAPVVVEETQCGVPPSRSATCSRSGRCSTVAASARLWLQRPGAPASVLGWFREFDPSFARTYWLRAPSTLPPTPASSPMRRAGSS